jgi:hypothetical protein
MKFHGPPEGFSVCAAGATRAAEPGQLLWSHLVQHAAPAPAPALQL